MITTEDKQIEEQDLIGLSDCGCYGPINRMLCEHDLEVAKDKGLLDATGKRIVIV